MKCPTCSSDNPEDARFCVACGTSLGASIASGAQVEPAREALLMTTEQDTPPQRKGIQELDAVEPNKSLGEKSTWWNRAVLGLLAISNANRVEPEKATWWERALFGLLTILFLAMFLASGYGSWNRGGTYGLTILFLLLGVAFGVSTVRPPRDKFRLVLLRLILIAILCLCILMVAFIALVVVVIIWVLVSLILGADPFAIPPSS